MGKTDLEDLMLNRWFEKTVHKDRLWPDQSVSDRIFKFK